MNHSTRLGAALPSCKASDRERRGCRALLGRALPRPRSEGRGICPLLLPGCGEGRTAAGGSRGLRPAFSSCCWPSLRGGGGSQGAGSFQQELPWVQRQQTWGFIYLLE